MSNCLDCKEPLIQVPKKREKQFCNSTCRSNYWQKMARKNQNKTKSDDVGKKKGTSSEKKEKPANDQKTMPEGLDWKAQLEWLRSNKS